MAEPDAPDETPEDIPDPTPPPDAPDAPAEEEDGEPVPSAEVEPLLSLEEYVLVTPALHAMTPAVQKAAIAGFKTWLRREAPAVARHASVAVWDNRFAACMAHT